MPAVTTLPADQVANQNEIGSPAVAAPITSKQSSAPATWRNETVPTSIGHCHKIMLGNELVACVYVDHRHPSEKDARTVAAAERARLIAAAPDMKAQLESTLHTLGLLADAYPLGGATRNTLEEECAAIRATIALASKEA
jgi:hypothetical protein